MYFAWFSLSSWSRWIQTLASIAKTPGYRWMIKPTRSITISASILKSDGTFPPRSIPIPIRLTVIKRQRQQWFYKIGNFKVVLEGCCEIIGVAVLIPTEKLVVDSIPIPSILKKCEFWFQFWNQNCPNTDSNDRNILPVNLWLRPPASPLQQFCCMMKIHLKYTNPAR